MELFNNKMNLLKNITVYEDKCIESSFNYPYRILTLYVKNDEDIDEGYIKDNQLYHIETITKYKDCNKIQCFLDLSELEEIYFEKFEVDYKTIDENFKMLLSNSIWKFKKSNLDFKRNVVVYNSNGIDIIKKICEKFNVYVRFDNINKSIEIVQENKKEIYINKNIILKKSKNKRKIVTRIIPRGNKINIKNINNGLEYIDNNSYSDKVLPTVWYDNSYTKEEDLFKDAIYKLSQICKPKYDYILQGSLNIGDIFTYDGELLYVIQDFKYEKNINNNIYIATNSKINIETTGDKVKEISDFINIKGITSDDLITLDNTMKTSIKKIEDNITYDVDIISTNGIVFKNNLISTTLIARVYHGSKDITDEIDEGRFIWTRTSNNTEGDIIWNHKYAGGRKQINITRDDVFNRATFNCQIKEK